MAFIINIVDNVYIAVQGEENVSSWTKFYGKSIPPFNITTKRRPACIYLMLSVCNFKKWYLLSYRKWTCWAQTDLIAEIGGCMQVCSKSAVIWHELWFPANLKTWVRKNRYLFLQQLFACCGITCRSVLFFFFFFKRFALIYKSLNLEKQTGLSLFPEVLHSFHNMCLEIWMLFYLESRGERNWNVGQFEMFYIF